MADFEDANSPTWVNNVEGQLDLRDDGQGGMGFPRSHGGKEKRDGSRAGGDNRPAARLALVEGHLLVDGQPISGSLFDFGLFFFHNAGEQLARERILLLSSQAREPPRRGCGTTFFIRVQGPRISPGNQGDSADRDLPATFEMDEIL